MADESQAGLSHQQQRIRQQQQSLPSISGPTPSLDADTLAVQIDGLSSWNQLEMLLQLSLGPAMTPGNLAALCRKIQLLLENFSRINPTTAAAPLIGNPAQEPCYSLDPTISDARGADGTDSRPGFVNTHDYLLERKPADSNPNIRGDESVSTSMVSALMTAVGRRVLAAVPSMNAAQLTDVACIFALASCIVVESHIPSKSKVKPDSAGRSDSNHSAGSSGSSGIRRRAGSSSQPGKAAAEIHLVNRSLNTSQACLIDSTLQSSVPLLHLFSKVKAVAGGDLFQLGHSVTTSQTTARSVPLLHPGFWPAFLHQCKPALVSFPITHLTSLLIAVARARAGLVLLHTSNTSSASTRANPTSPPQRQSSSASKGSDSGVDADAISRATPLSKSAASHVTSDRTSSSISAWPSIEWLSAAEAQAVLQYHSITSQEAADLISAFALLDHCPGSKYLSLMVIDTSTRMSARALNRIQILQVLTGVAGVSHGHHPGESWVRKVGSQILAGVSGTAPADLIDAMAAVASLQCRPGPIWVQAVLDGIRSNGSATGFLRGKEVVTGQKDGIDGSGGGKEDDREGELGVAPRGAVDKQKLDAYVQLLLDGCAGEGSTTEVSSPDPGLQLLLSQSFRGDANTDDMEGTCKQQDLAGNSKTKSFSEGASVGVQPAFEPKNEQGGNGDWCEGDMGVQEDVTDNQHVIVLQSHAMQQPQPQTKLQTMEEAAGAMSDGSSGSSSSSSNRGTHRQRAQKGETNGLFWGQGKSIAATEQDSKTSAPSTKDSMVDGNETRGVRLQPMVVPRILRKVKGKESPTSNSVQRSQTPSLDSNFQAAVPLLLLTNSKKQIPIGSVQSAASNQQQRLGPSYHQAGTPQQQQEQLREQQLQQPSILSGSQLAHLSWSLSTFSFCPSPSWLVWFETECSTAATSGQLQPHHAADILHSLANLPSYAPQSPLFVPTLLQPLLHHITPQSEQLRPRNSYRSPTSNLVRTASSHREAQGSNVSSKAAESTAPDLAMEQLDRGSTGTSEIDSFSTFVQTLLSVAQLYQRSSASVITEPHTSSAQINATGMPLAPTHQKAQLHLQQPPYLAPQQMQAILTYLGSLMTDVVQATQAEVAVLKAAAHSNNDPQPADVIPSTLPRATLKPKYADSATVMSLDSESELDGSRWAALVAVHCDIAVSDLSDLMLAIAELGCIPERWILDLVLRLSQPQLYKLQPDRYASFVWSLAVLKQQPPKSWLREYLTNLRSTRVKQLSSNAISELLWGLCVLRHVPGVWQTGEIVGELQVRLTFMNAQSFTDIAWALASFGHVPPEAWQQIFAQEVLFRMTPSPTQNVDPGALGPLAEGTAKVQPLADLRSAEGLLLQLTQALPLPPVTERQRTQLQKISGPAAKQHRLPLLQSGSMWEALRRSWLVDPDSLDVLDPVGTDDEAYVLLAQRRQNPAWAQQQLDPKQVAVAVWALGVWGYVPAGPKGQATMASMAEVLMYGME